MEERRKSLQKTNCYPNFLHIKDISWCLLWTSFYKSETKTACQFNEVWVVLPLVLKWRSDVFLIHCWYLIHEYSLSKCVMLKLILFVTSINLNFALQCHMHKLNTTLTMGIWLFDIQYYKNETSKFLSIILGAFQKTWFPLWCILQLPYRRAFYISGKIRLLKIRNAVLSLCNLHYIIASKILFSEIFRNLLTKSMLH
jgi:hypothetical protein